MKRLLILIAIFVLCTSSILGVVYTNYKNNKDEGDAPFEYDGLPDKPTLGGTIDNPVNSYLSMSMLQVEYTKYMNDEIDFTELSKQTVELLGTILNVPFTPIPNYLFSVGYADNSKQQIYYQSNKDEDRTIIYRVYGSEQGNSASVIYDGDYFKLVYVDENPNELIGFDINDEPHIIEVQ